MVIGENNHLPWHLPRDLRFFRTVTENATVIMGRKTYESIGKRTLPRRRNIVVTRQENYIVPGGEAANSLEEAIEMARDERYVFVIGGGELYRQAVPIADHLLLTQISHRSQNIPLFPVFRGDIYFPEISESQWKCVKHSRWFKATSARTNVQLSKDLPLSLYFRFLRFDKIVNDKLSSTPPKLFFRTGKLLNSPKSTTKGKTESTIDSVQKQLPL